MIWTLTVAATVLSDDEPPGGLTGVRDASVSTEDVSSLFDALCSWDRWGRGRWEFLFAAAPLRIVGDTGSPLNRVAVLRRARGWRWRGERVPRRDH